MLDKDILSKNITDSLGSLNSEGKSFNTTEIWNKIAENVINHIKDNAEVYDSGGGVWRIR